MNWNYGIYGVHVAFWSSFGVTRSLLSKRETANASAEAPKAENTATAPYSRALLGFHMVAFSVMYFGVGQAVFGRQVYELFPFQRLAATIVIAVGAAVACWALTYFHSWRFRAKIEAGHELATGGPFALIRHPIYLALDLLAVGTLLWIPSRIEVVAVALMVTGSDLRARAEEKILLAAFGERYRAYMTTSKRFVPGLY